MAREFAENLGGTKTKVGNLQLKFSEDSVVGATEIPAHGEQWFKNMQLDMSHYHDFLNPKFRNSKFGATIPREFLLKSHSDLLRVIQKFFTCEGKFDKVRQYHIRILMHFTRKKPLNIPFYLFRSLGKMANKVHLRKQQGDAILFNFSLIKLLVLEELRNRNQD